MSEKDLAVTVKVRREDGRVEHVRVGTAYRSGSSFRVRFAEMSIGATGAVQAVPAAAEVEPLKLQAVSAKASAAPAMPTTSAEPSAVRRLEYFAERARKNLANPAKARWHQDERALLEEIEAELARQRGLTSRAEPRGDERGAA